MISTRPAVVTIPTRPAARVVLATQPWRNRLVAIAPLIMLAALGPVPARGDGDGVAVADGRMIAREELLRRLIEAHGLDMLNQLMLLELCKAETARRGLRVTEADVDREFETALDEIAREARMSSADASRENKLSALQIVLQQRRISMTEYRIAMERNAHLRAVVRQDFKVDEPTLREEFARTYGERVVVRHIQVGDMRRLNDVLNQLAGGEDFAAVARRRSENPESAPRGGELDAFAFDDPSIPGVMREAAFALRPGEVSAPVRTDEAYHILKLERRVPPQDVKFENVRQEVEVAMRQRVEREQMARLMERLYQPAKLRVIDPTLRAQQEAAERARAAAPALRP
jgi:foldase protein PrsA